MRCALCVQMLHTARRACPGTLLFHTWAEAGFLWRSVLSRASGVQAFVLMPDHLHLLTAGPVDAPVAHALRAFALWRNHHRGERGPVLAPGGTPTVADGRVKQRRDMRYIALNPCRAGLVGDPLTWPFSSHRDVVGLAVPPVRRAVRDVHSLHAYVSSDPHVAVGGTVLPCRRDWGPVGPSVAAVRGAVSALTRTTTGELGRRGGPRSLLLRAAVRLCHLPDRRLGEALGCGRDTLRRARRSPLSADVRLVERVVGDARFSR
jgi:hypothetical protein